MKRKNNIFYSAFVLIATFAFILSPLSVYAAGDSDTLSGQGISEDTCTGNNGVVVTNFYMFLEGTWVASSDYTQEQMKNNISDQYPDGSSLDTGKTFNLGKKDADNEYISSGKVNVGKTGGDSTSTTSWSYEAFYRKYKEGGQNVDSGTVKGNSDGTIYWATDMKWRRPNGQMSTGETTTDYTVEALVNATYPSVATFPSIETVTISPNSTGLFQISRPIDADAMVAEVSVAEATAAGGHIYNPQVYYVKYCNYKTGSNDNTPTSTGFIVDYNANGGVDAPGEQKSSDGSPVTITNDKPNRTGFTFLGWSTNKDATEPDSKYAAGKSYAGPNDLHLYAVWSPKTGVSDYLMATAIIAGVAGLGLFISRRKRLFKQI